MVLKDLSAAGSGNLTSGLRSIFGSLEWNPAQISSFQHSVSDGYLSAFCNNNDRVSDVVFAL